MNCEHSNMFYDETLDEKICIDCGVVIKHPQYVNEYAPYNFDISNNYYCFKLEQQFNVLNYHYNPIYIKMIKDKFYYLKSTTGRVSHEFLPVSIYYGLRDIKPIKPASIDTLLVLDRGTSHKFIKKYAQHFKTSFVDRDLLDKRQFRKKRINLIEL